jgi:hypothetical protein
MIAFEQVEEFGEAAPPDAVVVLNADRRHGRRWFGHGSTSGRVGPNPSACAKPSPVALAVLGRSLRRLAVHVVCLGLDEVSGGHVGVRFHRLALGYRRDELCSKRCLCR